MNPKFISPGKTFYLNFKLIYSAVFSTLSHIRKMHSKHNILKLSTCSSTNPGLSSCSHCPLVNGNFFPVGQTWLQALIPRLLSYFTTSSSANPPESDHLSPTLASVLVKSPSSLICIISYLRDVLASFFIPCLLYHYTLFSI